MDEFFVVQILSEAYGWKNFRLNVMGLVNG